jgi:hypothetical protein
LDNAITTDSLAQDNWTMVSPTPWYALPESKNPGAVALTSAMKKESRNSTEGIGAVWVGPLDNNAQVVHPLFNQGCFDSNRGVARYPKVRVYVRHE